MQNKLKISNIIIGGVSASVILWLLMKFNMKYAWWYLIIVILGLLFVYQKQFFNQLNQTIVYLRGL